VAEEIINRCSMCRSRIDLSLLYETPKMLLYMFEFKKRLDTREMLRQAVEQTVCYMLGPLAYSRWGRWGEKEPIVAFIVCFNSAYRLTLSKQTKEMFGFDLKVEETKDVEMMEWVLHKTLMRYIEDFNTLSESKWKSPSVVNPFSWIPMNIDICFGPSNIGSLVVHTQTSDFSSRAPSQVTPSINW